MMTTLISTAMVYVFAVALGGVLYTIIAGILVAIYRSMGATDGFSRQTSKAERKFRARQVRGI